jgi:hypothetical protein
MKRLLLVLTVAAIMAAMMVASAMPALADPPLPSNANGCVGQGVSTSAHATQSFFGTGFGDFLHDNGDNPGQTIQQLHNHLC